MRSDSSASCPARSTSGNGISDACIKSCMLCTSSHLPLSSACSAPTSPKKAENETNPLTSVGGSARRDAAADAFFIVC